jgi:hypothetical protein
MTCVFIMGVWEVILADYFILHTLFSPVLRKTWWYHKPQHTRCSLSTFVSLCVQSSLPVCGVHQLN